MNATIDLRNTNHLCAIANDSHAKGSRIMEHARCQDCGISIAQDPNSWPIYYCVACASARHDDAASDAYTEHQRICGSTHRPRGYRCHLVSPFTTTEHLPDWSRATKMAGLTFALAALLVTAPGTSAADTITYQGTNGRAELVLPYIGTPAYSASCTIYAAWEDHSALAWCTEDGATYVYDPDGDLTTGKTPGWYPRD